MRRSLSQLPPEILPYIFYHLDIPDILRVRRVSRYLNAASYSREVWSNAYRKSDFVRPPGPFPSQSACNLENALASSFRSVRNLRRRASAPAWGQYNDALKPRVIRYTGQSLHVCMISGRFLLVVFRDEIRCYDLDLDTTDSSLGMKAIYRPTGATITLPFHCVSAFDPDGRPIACVVLSEWMQSGEATRISAYSLKIVEPSDLTLEFLHRIEHNMFRIIGVDLGPRVLVIQGEGGPCSEPAEWHFIALEVHTCTQFLLPSFIDEMSDVVVVRVPFHPELTYTVQIPEFDARVNRFVPASISTSTHLLLAGSFYTKTTGWTTLIQAFILPRPGSNPHPISHTASLSPSHRGIIPNMTIRGRALLQDATFDATTQDTLITVQVNAFEPSRPHHSFSKKFGVLRLASTHTRKNGTKLGSITFQVLGSFGSIPLLIRPSFNGTCRTFFTCEWASSTIEMREYNICGGIRGDTSNENENDSPKAKIIEHTVIRFPSSRRLLDYDPYSGRIACFRSITGTERVIEIYDLGFEKPSGNYSTT